MIVAYRCGILGIARGVPVVVQREAVFGLGGQGVAAAIGAAEAQMLRLFGHCSGGVAVLAGGQIAASARRLRRCCQLE